MFLPTMSLYSKSCDVIATELKKIIKETLITTSYFYLQILPINLLKFKKKVK